MLTREVTLYLSVYSTMFEPRHSLIVVDDCIQTYMQENRHTAYDDTQESTSILPYFLTFSSL